MINKNIINLEKLKHRDYKLSIKYKIKNTLKPLIINNKKELEKNDILKLNFNIDKISRYKNLENHALINFKNIGKNTFINVLYNNRIIYNKSIGKFKINNIKIKKKEKRFRKNQFSFCKEFTEHFFNNLKEKYKIENVSINFITKSNNYYTFKKFFFYKLIGLNYKKSRKVRKYNIKRNQFKEILRKEFPYIGRGSKGRGYSPYQHKKPKWYHLNNAAKITKYLFSFKTINLINVKIINRFPYNGCKKKKIRKI